MAKRVLLTGLGGFVGHHCLEYFLKYTDWEIVGIASYRHKGTITRVIEALDECAPEDRDRLTIYKHDLSVPIDPQLENLLLGRDFDGNEKPIDVIINMASESAVERSTVDPISCLRNNYELAINMLEFARRVKPELYVQISTDEIYGEASPDHAHVEWEPILPSNPYAASKAAQESLSIGYWRTYNLPVVITNCMNIIGERQDPEKFLPKIIQKISLGEDMPIYGDSLDSIGSRIYLHAWCMADALVFLVNRGKPTLYSDFVEKGQTYDARPDRYNICGDQELNNLELAQMVAGVMGKELNYHLVPSESARAGYDRRYALNGSKMAALGWQHPMTLKESVERIVAWSLRNPHWVVV